MHPAPDALVALAPDRLELDPGGGNVHGAKGAEVEILRTAAAVGDEIDLEKPGPGVVPLGEGADGDLVAQPGADARGGGAARRPGRARRGEKAPEGGGTDVAGELV